jgi:hypothetical protein
MIVYLYLSLVAKSCNCGGTKNLAILSSQDLGGPNDLKGKIAYSDYLHQKCEKFVLDIHNYPLGNLQGSMFVDYNHPTINFIDANNNVIFSTQLSVYPAIRNGRYQCTHK